MSLDVNVLKNNLTDVQRTFKWELDIPSPKGLGTNDLWNIRAISTVEPSESYEPIDIDYKGTAGFRVAGRRRLDHEFTVTLIEGEDGGTLDAIKSWMDIVGTTADSDYKTDMVISKYSYDDSTVTKRIKLIGCYPQKRDGGDLVSDASERQNYTVTFAFDDLEVE